MTEVDAMSTLRDRNVLDLTCVEGDRYVLIIIDDMQWDFGIRTTHARMLQDKINDYIGYIRSGQAQEARPGLRPVIRLLAQYPYSRYCLDFLGRFKEWIESEGGFCDLEWTHDEKDGPFEDGFSDEYVFDDNKIYPRLKKNWSKKPLEEVSLLAVNEHDYGDMPMFRIWDSYIICLMQDSGSVYSYLTYDALPQGIDVAALRDKAFENLSRDVSFRYEQSKNNKEIFGILCGGNFEAESLLFKGIWTELGEKFDDDLMVVAPTKDMVLFTKAGSRKHCNQLIDMGSEIFERNRKESPNLLFSRDVFMFSRKDEEFRIVPRKSL